MPDWKAEIRKRTAHAGIPPAREAEIVEELAQHLQDRYSELVAGGIATAVAERTALEELEGGLAQQLQKIERAVGTAPPLGSEGGGLFTGIWYDVKYGLRQLRLNPGFTLVAVLSLALGIGANTAIFQLINAVRLRALPVDRPEQLALVRIGNREWASGWFSGNYPMITNAQWEGIREQQQAFTGVFAWGLDTYDLAEGGESRYARALLLSGEAFAVLRLRPVAGRLFSPADDRRGCGAPPVVLSHAFWQREFGGDPLAVGKAITLNGNALTIVGVAPAEFFGVEVGRGFDVAVPLCADSLMRPDWQRLDRLHAWWLGVMGRLKPGWSLEQATAQLESFSPALFASTVSPSYNENDANHYRAFKLAAYPGATGISSLRRQYQDPLWLLMALSGSVLLIACANLANLMLARASAREREMAVRISLGAARGRIIRQLLTESLLLAIGGTLVGLLVAINLSSALVSFLSTERTRILVDLSLDWRMLGFTAGVAALTCLLFGLVPAVRASRTSAAAAMNAGGRGLTASRERFGLRRVLVVVQVALSLVLLVGSFLFSRTLRNLNTVDTGFRREGIVVVELDLSRMKLPVERRLPVQQELLDKVRAIPGVLSVAATAIVPVSGSGWNELVHHGDNKKPTEMTRITPEYLKTLDIALLAGRTFDERDNLAAPPVAIVNQKFVETFMDEGNPVGKTFRLVDVPNEPPRVFEIVGLVGNTKYRDLREDFSPIAYVPEAQDKEPDPFVSLLIRSDLPLSALREGVKRSVAEVSPTISLDFAVLDTQLRGQLLRERLLATLSGFFGVLAAVLATVGLYGVIAYMVIRRTNEIGIRMALGAEPRAILLMVMREAGQLVGAALVIGIGLTLLASRAVASLLYGLTPRDPISLIGAATALIGVALVAALVPAQRASELDPMAALRQE